MLNYNCQTSDVTSSFGQVKVMERKNISDQMFPLRLILVCVNREEIPFVFYLSENGEFRFSHVPEELQKGLP